MVRLLRRFSKDQSGVTAIEYALIATFIFLVIITAVTTVGGTLTNIFITVAGAF